MLRGKPARIRTVPIPVWAKQRSLRAPKIYAQDATAFTALQIRRFFGGLSLEEAAEALGVSERVVHRHWDRARAWLSREVRDSA
jgi:DNA-directed RNA polymerase specialized sigma24 family protein